MISLGYGMPLQADREYPPGPISLRLTDNAARNPVGYSLPGPCEDRAGGHVTRCRVPSDDG